MATDKQDKTREPVKPTYPKPDPATYPGATTQPPDEALYPAATTQEADEALRGFQRAQLEWSKSMHEASMSYSSNLASAYAAYQQALAEISREAWRGEMTALSDAYAGSPASERTPAGASEAFAKSRASLDTSRNEAFRKAAVVERKLAEELQRAWFDMMAIQTESNLQYQNSLKELSPVTQPQNFTIMGDEGAIPAASPMGWGDWNMVNWNMPWGV